jgi:hypothetical protein
VAGARLRAEFVRRWTFSLQAKVKQFDLWTGHISHRLLGVFVVIQKLFLVFVLRNGLPSPLDAE